MLDWEAVGARLRAARASRGLTQQQLGSRIGVSGAAISNWEKGKDLTTDRLFEVAPVLEVTVDELLTGNVPSPEHKKNILLGTAKSLRGRVVPRYTFDQAVRREESTVYTEEIRSHFPCSPNSFGLIINDRSNAPEFLPGDSVIIDPDLSPQPDDMVFALVGPERRPVFRAYVAIDSQRCTLKPKNESWPSFHLGPEDGGEIIGVMSEHTTPRRM